MFKIVITCLLVSTFSYCAQSAKVLTMRGDVTKLLPGRHKANSINKGDVLPEKTSVLTREKSMVRLLFADGTTVNLGPMSKIIISDLPKTKANVISLLTGTINASVNRNGNDKTKLLVKTKNSVMGVRGTKFKSGFNHLNSNTSLVTIEGNVAISKVRDQNLNALISESSKLNDELNSSDVVEVKAGKFSDVKNQIPKPSVPVKIAPVQYNALAKQLGSKKTAKDVMNTNDAQAEVESHMDKKSPIQNAYKPGGYVDFSTGLYVAPEREAIIDNNTGTFTATKKVGIINVYGDYEAPKGIKLDAKKGFVLASNSENVDKEILEDLQELQGKKSPRKKWIEKHILSFRLEPVLSSYQSDKDYYKSKESSNSVFSYEQIWNANWESGIFLGDKKWDLDRPSSRVRNNDGKDGKSTSMLDVRYNINAKYKLGLSLISESFPTIQENDFFEEYSINMNEYEGISPHLTYTINERHALNIRYKNFFEKNIDVDIFGPFYSKGTAVKIQTLKLTSMNLFNVSQSIDFVYDFSYEILAAKVEDYDDVNMDTLSLALGLKWSI